MEAKKTTFEDLDLDLEEVNFLNYDLYQEDQEADSFSTCDREDSASGECEMCSG